METTSKPLNRMTELELIAYFAGKSQVMKSTDSLDGRLAKIKALEHQLTELRAETLESTLTKEMTAAYLSKKYGAEMPEIVVKSNNMSTVEGADATMRILQEKYNKRAAV